MIQDVRNACRLFTRSRGFALTAVLMLALGIGANTAIFSVVDAALLRPLPYPQPDQLVALSYVDAAGHTSTGASPRAFLDWRERQQVFESLVATGGGVVVLAGDGEPEEVRLTKVTGDFFSMLRVQPAVGRTFGREAEEPGRDKIAVLGHEFWLRRYAGAPDIVGRLMRTDTDSYDFVGVLPPSFRYPAGRSPDVVVPRAFDAEDRQPGIAQSAGLSVEGRLAPGVPMALAAAQMSQLEATIDDRRATFNKGRRIVVTSMHEEVTGATRSWMLVLLGAVGFVLLVACVNVANLMLTRSLEST